MGAGHLSRPDFGKTQMDSQNPMSEFYECFLKGLEQGKTFAVPGCYARFKPDFSRQIYREDMPGYCTYSSIAGEGAVCVLEPAEFVIGQFELSLTARGAPMAVFIQSADGHHRLAVRLLPPFGGVELAAAPASVPLLELQITGQDLMQIDEAPAQLGRRWVSGSQNKQWAAHPAMEAWELRALAAAQREFGRMQGGNNRI